MKRSEMVELIQSEFNLVEGMAEEILALIEEKGMRPPSYNANSGFCRSYMVDEWETEDEKK